MSAALSLVILLGWTVGFVDWLVCRRIESLLATRSYDEAESLIGWLRVGRSSRAELSFWEGRLRRKQLQPKSAKELLQAALKQGYSPERVRREEVLLHAQAGDILGVRRELEAMLTDPGDEASEICEAFVNGALIDGETDLALSIIPPWQNDVPRDPQPHYARGRLHEHMLENAAAEKEYRQAIERDRRHWPAIYALGRLLLATNNSSEAIVQFESATRMKDNAAPRLQLAKTLRSLGKTDEARIILHELLDVPRDRFEKSFIRVGEPESGRPVELELGLLELGVQEPAKAVPWFEQVLKHDPSLLEARYSLAMAFNGMGRTDDARRELETVKRSKDAVNEADRLVDEISKKKGPCVRERFRIGELYLKHESRRRGLFWLRDALNRDPGYAPAHRLLAEYYQGLATEDPGCAELAERHRRAAAVGHDDPIDLPTHNSKPRRLQAEKPPTSAIDPE